MKTVKNAIIMLGISAIAAFVTPALAADAPAAPASAGPTFGIVDMNKVMQTTDAAKDIFSQLDSKRKEYLAQISKEEDSLRSMQQELEKDKSLSKDAMEGKKKAFEEKYQQWQKLAQNRKDVLDLAFEKAMNDLRQKAAEIVAEAAKQKHYSAVFTQNAVMMSTPDLDLTEEVIAQMNKSVKKIPIDWAAVSGAVSGGGKKK